MPCFAGTHPTAAHHDPTPLASLAHPLALPFHLLYHSLHPPPAIDPSLHHLITRAAQGVRASPVGCFVDPDSGTPASTSIAHHLGCTSPDAGPSSLEAALSDFAQQPLFTVVDPGRCFPDGWCSALNCVVHTASDRHRAATTPIPVALVALAFCL